MVDEDVAHEHPPVQIRGRSGEIVGEIVGGGVEGEDEEVEGRSRGR